MKDRGSLHFAKHLTTTLFNHTCDTRNRTRISVGLLKGTEMPKENLSRRAALIVNEREELLSNWRREVRRLPGAEKLDTPPHQVLPIGNQRPPLPHLAARHVHQLQFMARRELRQL
jgi:hypothetical protein